MSYLDTWYVRYRIMHGVEPSLKMTALDGPPVMKTFQAPFMGIVSPPGLLPSTPFRGSSTLIGLDRSPVREAPESLHGREGQAAFLIGLGSLGSER